MKCAECNDEIIEYDKYFIQGREKTRKLYFCSLFCKREYLKHILGDPEIHELNFEHRR